MELAIDTSTRYAAVALMEGERPLAEFSWRSERNHTVELAPLVQGLLDWPPARGLALEAVFVALGPGGWSSLRVGLSAAKGLTEARDMPLVGVGTLEVEAFPYGATGLPICPLLEVGRGEVAWALFQEEGGCWSQLRPEAVSSPEEVCRSLPPDTLLCGEAAWALGDRLRDALVLDGGARSGGVRVLAVPPPTRRAVTLARLGAFRLAAHGPDDRASLQPLYLRRPSITPPRGVRAAGSG